MLIYIAFLYAPRIDIHASVHYDMREIAIDEPLNQPSHPGSGSIGYPGPLSSEKSQGTRGDEAAHRPAAKLVPHAQIGPQTIMQPDLKTTVIPENEIPLPKVVLWSSNKLPTKNIVAPKPVKPPAANVNPQINLPNQEVNLADIPLASTSRIAVHALAPAANTTPIVVKQPSPQIQLAQITTTESQLQPTPAAVMSLSEIHVNNTNVPLPPINETSPGDANGALASAKTKPVPGPGNQDAPLKSTGNGSAKTPGTHPGVGTAANSSLAMGGAGASPLPSSGGGKSPHPGGGGNGAGSGNAQGGSAGAGSSQTAGSGSGDGDQLTDTKISRPPDGRFGAVVVGTSLRDEFPEMGDLWQGRMAFTVYLHVGLAKSWILQYALPRDADAAEAGSVGRIDAPWPFSIVRPNLTPGVINADALLVHGYVNTAGRFEKVEVVFPPRFPLTSFVLQALSQWQFRPAIQDGKPVRVEVLLVIPDEEE